MEQNTVSVSDQTVDPSLNESIVSEKNTVSVMGTELVEQNTVSDQTSDPCQPKRKLSVKENAVIGTEHCYYSTSGTEDCQ